MMDKPFPDLRKGKYKRERKRGGPTNKVGAKPDHRWQYEQLILRKPKKWAGENGLTGERLPNTLDYWVASALRGKRGVVLSYAKTLELAQRLGITTEPREDEPAHRPVPDSEVTPDAYLVQPYLPGFEPGNGELGPDDDTLTPDCDPDE